MAEGMAVLVGVGVAVPNTATALARSQPMIAARPTTSAIPTATLKTRNISARSPPGKSRTCLILVSSWEKGDIYEITAAEADGTVFTVFRKGRRLGDVSLPLPGSFNAVNALAAITVGLELGVDFEELAGACAQFSGVARRFEVLGNRSGVMVVDDYAHHPTEIKAVLEATRQAMPGRRVVVVFQPHLYSRTRDFASEFAAALLAAEVAMILPVYPAREEPIDGVSSQLVVEEAIRLGHPRVFAGPSVGGAVRQLNDILEQGDVLLTVGAGDVDDVAAAWLEGVA